MTAVEALKELIAHRCVVLRDGRPVDVLAAELVEGDVVQLAAGVRIPADLRIFESSSLAVNESLLTGEPESAAKYSDPLDAAKGINLAERANMAFMGTSVAAGTGLGLVTAIGKATELGRISEMLQEKEKKTPLQLSMDDFGKRLSLFSLVVIIVISVIGFLQGKPALQMFNMAVSLIVAAIPEGLPIAVTVTLALGVTRMSARNAIVRKLPAVEALGATNVICVDKTGTLTQNQMTVSQVFTNRLIDVVHEKVITTKTHHLFPTTFSSFFPLPSRMDHLLSPDHVRKKLQSDDPLIPIRIINNEDPVWCGYLIICPPFSFFSFIPPTFFFKYPLPLSHSHHPPFITAGRPYRRQCHFHRSRVF